MKLLRLNFPQFSIFTFLLSALAICAGCSTFPPPGTAESRNGDEIVAAGQFFHTGTRVVLWTDPDGYDAYRIFPRFTGVPNDPPKLYTGIHYDVRNHDMTPEEFAAVHSGNWTF